MKLFNCEGLEPLSMEEIGKVEGGQISGWVKAVGKTLTIGFLITGVIDNWAEVKEGFSAGVNDWSRK